MNTLNTTPLRQKKKKQKEKKERKEKKKKSIRRLDPFHENQQDLKLCPLLISLIPYPVVL